MYSVISIYCHSKGRIERLTKDEIIYQFAGKEKRNDTVIIFEEEWENAYDFADRLNEEDIDKCSIYFPTLDLWLSENCRGRRYYPELFNIVFINKTHFLIRYNDKYVVDVYEDGQLMFFDEEYEKKYHNYQTKTTFCIENGKYLVAYINNIKHYITQKYKNFYLSKDYAEIEVKLSRTRIILHDFGNTYINELKLHVYINYKDKERIKSYIYINDLNRDLRKSMEQKMRIYDIPHSGEFILSYDINSSNKINDMLYYTAKDYYDDFSFRQLKIRVEDLDELATINYLDTNYEYSILIKFDYARDNTGNLYYLNGKNEYNEEQELHEYSEIVSDYEEHDFKYII
jgi:hypothetical protein